MRAVIDSFLDCDPVTAGYLGDHRGDGALPDASMAGAAARVTALREQLGQLRRPDINDGDDCVDRAILHTALRAELFDLDDLREPEWNPMLTNPGPGLHALLTRDTAPMADRLRSLHSRLRAVPDHLRDVRTRLGRSGPLSRIHTQTAIGQFDGTLALLDEAIPAALADHPQLASAAGDDLARARAAVAGHRDWLHGQLAGADRDPRLGAAPFAARLALTLDTEFDPQALLLRAEEDLDRVAAELTEAAGTLLGVPRPDAGTVRAALHRCTHDVPTDDSILRLCREAMREATEFTRTAGLVTVYDDPIEVIEMPEIERGVSVAHCVPPGPLEAVPPPTQFAVSPTPAAWTEEQVASFYREYNRHMLHELAVHEAVPGHALQLAHSNRHRAGTPVREIWISGSFVEGWAVYAEELMVAHGYRREVSEQDAAMLRLQQLKMQLRMTLNAVLDVRYHCHDLDEAAAMALMVGRGFQEQGEAMGKWRRVQLTSTQLCTYYVGYREVRDLVADLHRARPEAGTRELHDAVLAHGSPPVRHLRTILGLAG